MHRGCERRGRNSGLPTKRLEEAPAKRLDASLQAASEFRSPNKGFPSKKNNCNNESVTRNQLWRGFKVARCGGGGGGEEDWS